MYMPSKSARMKSMVVNRPTCGGSKKAGLAPRSTSYYGQWFMQRRSAHKIDKYSYPESCIGAGRKFGLEYCIRYLKRHIKELNGRINWGLDKVFPDIDPKEGPRIHWEKKYLVLGAWADIRGILEIFSTQPGVDPLHPFKSLDFWGIDYRNYHGRLRRCIQKVNASVPDGNIDGTGEGHVIGISDNEGWTLSTHMLGLFTQSEMNILRNSPLGYRKYGINLAGQNIIWYVKDDERLPSRTNSALYAFDSTPDVICQNVASYPFDTEFKCKGNHDDDNLYLSLYQGGWPGLGDLPIEDAKKFWAIGSYFVKKRKFNTIYMNVNATGGSLPGFSFVMTPDAMATLATYLPKEVILGAIVEASPKSGFPIPGELERQEPGGSNACNKVKLDENYTACTGDAPNSKTPCNVGNDTGPCGYGSLLVNSSTGEPINSAVKGCPNAIENAMYLIGKANSYIKDYNTLNPDHQCPYFTHFMQDGENNGSAIPRYADWLHAIKTYILPNLPQDYKHYTDDAMGGYVILNGPSSTNGNIDERMKAIRIGKAKEGTLNANALFFEFKEIGRSDIKNTNDSVCKGGCAGTDGCPPNSNTSQQYECLQQIPPTRPFWSGNNLSDCFTSSDDLYLAGTQGTCGEGALFTALPETYWYLDGMTTEPKYICPIGYQIVPPDELVTDWTCNPIAGGPTIDAYQPLGCNGADHNIHIMGSNIDFDIYNYDTGSGAGTDTTGMNPCTPAPGPPPNPFPWPQELCSNWKQIGSSKLVCPTKASTPDGCPTTIDDFNCFQNPGEYSRCKDTCGFSPACCICQCNKTACGYGGRCHLDLVPPMTAVDAEQQNIYLAYRNNFGGGTNQSLANKFASNLLTGSTFVPLPDSAGKYTKAVNVDAYNTRGTLPMFSNEVTHQQYQQHPVTSDASLSTADVVAAATQRQCLSQFPRGLTNSPDYEPDPTKTLKGAPSGFCGTANFFGSWGADGTAVTYKSGWQHFHEFIQEFRDNAYRGGTSADDYNRSQYALYEMQFLREDWITDDEPTGSNLLTSYADTTTAGYFDFTQLPAVPLQRFKEVAAADVPFTPAPMISVGNKYLWVVQETTNDIWYTSADNLLTDIGDWTQLNPYKMGHITVTDEYVYGHGAVDLHLYRWNSDGTSGITKLTTPAAAPPTLKEVTADEEYLWIIATDNTLWYIPIVDIKVSGVSAPGWKQLPLSGGTHSLKNITIGGDWVYGVGVSGSTEWNGRLWRWPSDGTQVKKTGWYNYKQRVLIDNDLRVNSVSAEGNMVWIVSTDGTAYFAATPEDATNMHWIMIEDQYLPVDTPPDWKKLNNIAYISISHLWCYVVDGAGNIWRQTSWPCDKYQDTGNEPTMNIQKFGPSNGIQIGKYCNVANEQYCKYW